MTSIEEREVIFFCFVLDTTRDTVIYNIIIIISPLMSPPLEHRLSLWITYEENGPYPNSWAHCGLVGANDY
jgi:hypothetical protein